MENEVGGRENESQGRGRGRNKQTTLATICIGVNHMSDRYIVVNHVPIHTHVHNVQCHVHVGGPTFYFPFEVVRFMEVESCCVTVEGISWVGVG